MSAANHNDIALRCVDVAVQFGALRALDGVTYDFRRGGL